MDHRSKLTEVLNAEPQQVRHQVVETNLSQVFLTPDRAYKMLRPVTTPFVDFADREQRLAAARAEFELNRRISPDVYLGCSDIEEHGTLVDRMIVMKRLPESRRLDHLLTDPDLAHQIRRVARLVASFHAGQPPITGPEAEPASSRSLARNWSENFAALAPLVGPVIPVDEFNRIQTLVSDYIEGRQTLLNERIAHGWVRDGHGDLRAEHVFCLDDGPRLIDCLAFRDDFRINDVLNDVAFLAMDLHRLAGPETARRFVAWYDEFSNERHPAGLAHQYVAYRAYVRAKVAAIRFAQTGHGTAPSAAGGPGMAASGSSAVSGPLTEVLQYHRLALQHLEVGRPRMVLVGGGAGVGKSTVAGQLADHLTLVWLRADEIRKELAGLAPGTHAFGEPDTGLYDPTFTDAVYTELLARAEAVLARGESVVLDASWACDRHRRMARSIGRAMRTEVVELRCVAPDPVARERVARRMASMYNPSDATPEVVDHLVARFEHWPEARTVDTDQPVDRTIAAAYCRVMADPDSARTDSPRTGSARTDLRSVRVDAGELTSETIAFYLRRTAPTVPTR